MEDPGRARELVTLPGLVELDITTGEVRVSRTALPRAAERIVFGRGLAARVVPEVVVRLVDPARPGILVVVGESSSKAPEIAALLDKLRRLADNGTAALRLEVLEVRGHADHHAIRAGIAAVRRSGAGLVVAIGGGTTIDVGKSVAALACQEDERSAGACGGMGSGTGASVSANVTEGMGWTADTATGGGGTGGEASAGTAAHSPAGSARAGFQRVATAHAHADASADADTGVGPGKSVQMQHVQLSADAAGPEHAALLIHGVPGGSELLFRWLETRIPALFAATGLPHSLRAAGLTRADLDWIVARELESRPSFGTPARPGPRG